MFQIGYIQINSFGRHISKSIHGHRKSRLLQTTLRRNRLCYRNFHKIRLFRYHTFCHLIRNPRCDNIRLLFFQFFYLLTETYIFCRHRQIVVVKPLCRLHRFFIRFQTVFHHNFLYLRLNQRKIIFFSRFLLSFQPFGIVAATTYVFRCNVILTINKKLHRSFRKRANLRCHIDGVRKTSHILRCHRQVTANHLFQNRRRYLTLCRQFDCRLTSRLCLLSLFGNLLFHSILLVPALFLHSCDRSVKLG